MSVLPPSESPVSRASLALRLADVRAIVVLAWPVLVGQLAIIAFGVIDTAMVGRYSAESLASLGLGASIYISVFVALTGILVALSPIAGNLYGAGRVAEIGEQTRQAIWLAVALSVIGAVLLTFPAPLLDVAKADAALRADATRYLRILAVGLPAALLFRIFNSLSTAIGKPRIVMTLQIVSLAVKIPANYALIFGFAGLAPMGGIGCALASTLINGIDACAALWIMARGSAFQPLQIFSRFSWPQWPHQRALLKLGIPMGVSYLIEVTSYTFMALFIARFGTATLAAHQIAGNMGAVLYMTPLSIGIGTATLVAQRIGADRLEAARRLSGSGILLASIVGLFYAGAVLLLRGQIAAAYTSDAHVAATAAGLLMIVAAYHVFDAFQVSTAFVLRSYQVTVIPTAIYAIALWGVGLGGGYWMGFDLGGHLPHVWTGANGFWIANTLSLGMAGIGLGLYRRHVVRRFKGNRQA
ncbi:MATE family efflux transporter [Robbsia sp. KACC 23696]|uniref:MATE family efflux transporter n=1 Tax=Robbsia sp. KACC 23696 TaxID=3149231 RepID=UPI00325AD8E1